MAAGARKIVYGMDMVWLHGQTVDVLKVFGSMDACIREFIHGLMGRVLKARGREREGGLS